MILSDEKIKEIAEELILGMSVYINKKTFEIITFVDLSFYDEDEYDEQLSEDLKKIEDNPLYFYNIDKMDSHQEFKIMQNFADTVDDPKLKSELQLVLCLEKPFRNFKTLIDDAGEYREKWFSFKDDAYFYYVKDELEILD